MNIYDVYCSFQKKRTEELKALLDGVMREFLRVSEDIPKEKSLEVFKRSDDRNFVHFSAPSPFFLKEGGANTLNISVGSNYAVDLPDAYMAEYNYNDESIKELDSFINEYYPGITFDCICHANLYEGTMSFEFSCRIFDEEDQLRYADDPDIPVTEKEVITSSIGLFDDDLTIILNRPIDIYCWVALDGPIKDESSIKDLLKISVELPLPKSIS